MKKILDYLVKTHFGRIIIGMILTALGGSFAYNGFIGEHLYSQEPKIDIGNYIMFIGLGIVSIYTLIMMAYAFIINPLKKLKDKNK